MRYRFLKNAGITVSDIDCAFGVLKSLQEMDAIRGGKATIWTSKKLCCLYKFTNLAYCFTVAP